MIISRWQGIQLRGPIHFLDLFELEDELGESFRAQLLIHYKENGLKALQAESRDDGLCEITAWNPNGTVGMQWSDLLSGEDKASPPWWWGISDQVSPEKADGQ